VAGVRLKVVMVGRMSPFLEPARSKYLARIRHYLPVEFQELALAPAALPDERARSQEAARLDRALAGVAWRVALDREGVEVSSEALARRLEAWMAQGRDVGLAVGGSRGLHRAWVRQADEVWSFGPATWPHALCAVMLLEQLYRGLSLIRGEPYHRGG
jgi:23S rRNA (pseudouridine1915-N3)-methyltransferase